MAHGLQRKTARREVEHRAAGVRLADILADAVIAVDEAQRILLFNRSAEQIFGYRAEEVLGQPLDLLLSPRLAEAHRQHIRNFAAAPETARPMAERREISGRRKDGGEFPVEVGISKLTQDGQTTFIAILRDITERRRAEEEIRREAVRAGALARIAARLNAQLNLQAVLNAVCEETARALNAPASSVSLYCERRAVLYVAATYGLPPEYRQRSTPTPRAIYDDYARRTGPVNVVLDVQAEPGLPNAPAVYTDHNIRTIAVASLIREGQLAGAINVYSFGEPRAFSDHELSLLQGLADQATQAITNARLFEEARHRLDHVQALRDIDMAITGSLDLRVTLNVILDRATAQLGIDAAALLLLDPHTQILEYAAGRGFRTAALQHTRLRLGEGNAGRAALERHIVRIPDLTETPTGLARAPLLAGEAFVAYFAVPLLAKAEVKGVLEIFHHAPLDPDQEWLDFLEALAMQAAIAIDSAMLFVTLQRSNVELVLAYEATLEGWSRALELRDQETEGHTQRVTAMTLRLAHVMNTFGKAELAHIRRGALLHDIGKMGIPDSILHKPGPLTDAEWAVMRDHPVVAYELLLPIVYLRPALDIPYCHHEKWDGTGYPRGLRGEQIPLAARLFALADVWDALRSERPYRPAWPAERVREYIRGQAGTHFDPKVVEVFLRLDET